MFYSILDEYMKQLYVFFCTKLTILAYIKDHKMRYITVEDVIHTGIQTQITPDVQTHCLLVALMNVVFL